jgi:hypothetical protein
MYFCPEKPTRPKARRFVPPIGGVDKADTAAKDTGKRTNRTTGHRQTGQPDIANRTRKCPV